ncbi:MAG: glycosyltransferase family 4 protein, partial [Anaerolineae bacterium]|nr:glycosyltransferase family 4 protein [Anaerolineae bacterium]
TQSKLNVLWQHDLAMGRSRSTFCGALWNIDKVILLSEYHKEQYRAVYGLEDALMHVGRNGIDPDLFETDKVERDRYRLIYTARPERGLDVLLKEVFPELLRREPRFRLSIAAYHNPVDHMKDFYRQIDALISSFGEKVTWLGSLPKRELYQQYARAGMYVYPTPSPIMPDFQEISCITAMECQAAGLPFISTRNGALPETCAAIDNFSDGACLVNPGPDYVERFCDSVIRFAEDEDLWNAVSEAGQVYALRALRWVGVARDFHDLFVREIKERNTNQDALANHLWQRSDIIALEALCAG